MHTSGACRQRIVSKGIGKGHSHGVLPAEVLSQLFMHAALEQSPPFCICTSAQHVPRHIRDSKLLPIIFDQTALM